MPIYSYLLPYSTVRAARAYAYRCLSRARPPVTRDVTAPGARRASGTAVARRPENCAWRTERAAAHCAFACERGAVN